MEAFLFWTSVSVALVFVGLVIPLILRRVPPNRFYGFRTPKTMGDSEIWYPVNRLTGIWLVCEGAALGMAAIVATSGHLDTVVGRCSAVLLVGSLAMVVHGFGALPTPGSRPRETSG